MPRVDVTLVGIPQSTIGATPTPLSIVRMAGVPVPTVQAGSRVSPAAVARVASVPAAAATTPSRDDLVMGVDQPDASNTGVYPTIQLIPVVGNVTLSTPGQTLENRWVQGRVIVNAANVTIRNCKIDGGATTPGGLIDCTSVNVVNCLIVDCDIGPKPDGSNAHWNYGGPYGHDYTLLRCNIHHCSDGIGVFNTQNGLSIYPSGVTIQQNYVHDMAHWTAATGGIVHTTDTENHADVIQLQGGTGVRILGNTLNSWWAHGYAHYQAVGDSWVEPYVFIANQSMAAGAPGWGGPFRSPSDRGSGNFANGRYHTSNIHPLMVNSNNGDRTYGLEVTDNWVYGGAYGFNINPTRQSGEHMGVFYRNKFDHTQGTQGAGGNDTFTVGVSGGWVQGVSIDFDPGGPNRNVYMDNGVEIRVRGA